MNMNPDIPGQFDALRREIAEAESTLGSRFTAMPPVDPAVVSQIKARLRSETLRVSNPKRTSEGTMPGFAA